MKYASILIVFILVNTSWALVTHPNSGKKNGPWLFCISEGAELFEIGIDDQSFDYAATDGKLNIDLRWHFNQSGNYDLSIVPRNVDGSGKEIFFMLQIRSVKNGLLWEIIPLQYLIEEDPEYLESFSPNLEIKTGK